MSAVTADPAWFVFFGTTTTIVHAPTEAQAYRRFVALFAPDYGDKGRLVPPGRDEVRIRRPCEADRGWIEDSGDTQFLTALPKRREVRS